MTKETAIYSSLSDFRNSTKRASQASRLYVLSIAYFMLPSFIFLIGFTRWYVILLAGFSLAAAGFLDTRYELSRNRTASPYGADVKWFLLILLAACAWTSLFGAGFVGPQTGDQVKNHMIFRDLFEYAWPVMYSDMQPEMSFLSYPLGYYLVPAFIGKIFGWAIGALSIYIWTSIGIALLWSWFYVLFARFATVAIIIFIFFSGLDILGLIALGQATPAAGTHIEWWSGWTFLQYSSNATVMSWSTQHGAAQWLFPMLLLYRLILLKEIRGSALLVSIAAFWSHLTLIGAVLFLPLYFRENRIRQVFKDSSLLALPFLMVVAIFYASKAPGSIDMGFIWDLWPIGEALPKILWFYLFEFGILALIIFSIRQHWNKDEMWVFIASIIVLLIIPVYHIGWSNDVSMRVSAIPLFVLFILFCASIKEAFLIENKPAISFAVLYVLIAMFTPMNEMFRQLQQMIPQKLFISNLTDVNWDRGINRERHNCFITMANHDIALRAGDTATIKGVGSFEISEAHINGAFQNICVSPATVVINQRPAGSRSVIFSRGDKQLHGRIHLSSFLPLGEISSITKIWPQQYTGSNNSLFYKYLLNNDK